MKTLLVTGGAGFIGSHFVDHLLGKYSGYSVINLDLITYAANPSLLKHLDGHPRYRLIRGDICDSKLLQMLFEKFPIEGVIHFAAESHVDNSINEPSRFMQTNICGTQTLLHEVQKRWMLGPHRPRESCLHHRFHHISTDEVYGSANNQVYFSEEAPYRPSSPYSASKAASDLIVQSYFHTYGLNVVTTNCSNNYGPRQHSEKFIPTVINRALTRKTIPIYGNGSNRRNWLHVHDHCEAIDHVFHNAKTGQRFNVCGHTEHPNLTVAHMICQHLDQILPLDNGGSYGDQLTFVKDRPGHDQRYAVSTSKIETQLGWKPRRDFQIGLRETVEWYVSHLINQSASLVLT